MTKIDLVPTATFESGWPLAAPWVQSSAEASPSSEPPEVLEAMCREGTADLWLLTDHLSNAAGAIITEVVDTPKGRTCHFLAAAGSFLDDGAASLDTIEQWAKSQGCVRLELTGRLGWPRRLERRGWRECATVIGKDL